MGEGIEIPIPMYRYFGGAGWAAGFKVLCGLDGFMVGRHVHLKLSGRMNCFAWVLKLFLLGFYFWYQLYVEKGYLTFANSRGISRLQLQHPVANCNPLTQDHRGCRTNFTKMSKLPYCTQSLSPGAKAENCSSKKGPIPANCTRQEDCEYFDEFDLQLPGYQQDKLLVPTRLTKYTQDIDCKNVEEPCPRVDQLRETSTSYVADIENFTLLIDHSMVNEELGIERTAWQMIGFHNPCGVGKELEKESVNPITRKANHILQHKHEKTAAELEETGDCNFSPIHRPWGLLKHEESKKSKPNYDELTRKEAQRDRGFAMWMEDWKETLFPMPFLEPNNSKLAHSRDGPFRKITQGDIIKIGDLLRLIGKEADLDNPEFFNRYEGMVIVIDIHYSNWKEYTWPNRVEPAYFYTFSITPANEFKLMQDSSLRIGRAKDDKTGKRVIYDYHGIFIMVKQGGDMGRTSFCNIFVLILGGLVIETVFRSLFVLIVLNSNACGNCCHTTDKAHQEKLLHMIGEEWSNDGNIELGERRGLTADLQYSELRERQQGDADSVSSCSSRESGGAFCFKSL